MYYTYIVEWHYLFVILQVKYQFRQSPYTRSFILCRLTSFWPGWSNFTTVAHLLSSPFKIFVNVHTSLRYFWLKTCNLHVKLILNLLWFKLTCSYFLIYNGYINILDHAVMSYFVSILYHMFHIHFTLLTVCYLLHCFLKFFALFYYFHLSYIYLIVFYWLFLYFVFHSYILLFVYTFDKLYNCTGTPVCNPTHTLCRPVFIKLAPSLDLISSWGII